MSIFDRILDLLRGTPSAPPDFLPPTLRNRPGGLAYIRLFDEYVGAGALANRIVTTTRLSESGMWVIEPPQEWTATADCIYCGTAVRRGTRALTVAISDRMLEPIRDVGDEEQDESLRYLPPVPRSETVRVKAEGARA